MQHRTGFSLVEMSVVIIVIGLILAAVMQGRTVIEAAKVRTLVAETISYRTAIHSFYTKYAALPGDFTEAETYWGSTGAQNGDGNGKISFKNSSGIYEGYQAWQHLSNEQMVPIPFTGTQTTAAAELNIDVPKTKWGGGYFFDDGNIGNFSGENLLILGKPLASSTRLTLGGLFSPTAAYHLDEKLDDGLPNTGGLQAEEGYGETTGRCVNAGAYTMSIDAPSCIMACRLVTE